MIYLDNCATTPLDPAAADAMHRVNLEIHGNPGSIHSEGRRAAKVLADSRRILAESIGAQPQEIVLTSSGTEANNLAIAGVVNRFRKDGPVHIITSTTEHASVRSRLAFEQRLHGSSVEVTEVPVDAQGLLDFELLHAAVRPHTRLVTLLHCNNETGALQSIDEIAAIKLRHPAILLHLDIVQSYLKTDFDVRTLAVDFLTTAAHKVHGPKGIGFLYVRSGVEIEPVMVGGGQEKFRRAGTENVAAAAGFAAAVQNFPDTAALHDHLLELEKAFLNELCSRSIVFQLNGPGHNLRRMAGIFNISLPGTTSKEDLQIALDLEGVQVSSTSACHSGIVTDSHVLKAMGLAENRRACAIRIGLNRMLKANEVVIAARKLASVLERIHNLNEPA
jgi:cysteine desulfurase